VQRTGLARAMFVWIETFDNPTRGHPTLGDLSPFGFETPPRHDHQDRPRPSFGGHSRRSWAYRRE